MIGILTTQGGYNMAIYKTTDNAKDERLVTNWYQNSFEQCSDAVKRVCSKYGYKLKYENKAHGEFIFERARDTLDVQIVSLNRRDTAIDFVINSNVFFDFGRSKAVIEDLYERLRNELNYFRK